jgi:hypothetical protein
MSIIVDPPYRQEVRPFRLIDFARDEELFIIRPPYQRKNVWPPNQKKALMRSFFQRHYVPNIVLRDVETPDRRLKFEVVDGQQRINTIQEFIKNDFRLFRGVNEDSRWAGKTYEELSPAAKIHINNQTLYATVLTGLTNPANVNHQKTVAQVFWNLQQGKTLTNMEVEHSKLYSAARNFITKYADDISFDSVNYVSRDFNPNRHNFFKIINVDNKRLNHLAFLGRFLLLEFKDGPSDIGQRSFTEFIDDWDSKDISEFENKTEAKKCLKTLDSLYQIFSDDPSVRKNGVVPELDREYLIISTYLLARRLINENWNFKSEHYSTFRNFVYDFYQRWRKNEEEDNEMRTFRENRRQDKRGIEIRDQLITKWFFEFYPDLDKLDPQRSFTYSQRIAIYRKNQGICQACKDEGLSDDLATVPWNKFDADHFKAHSKGGFTTIKNGQVLCQKHNRSFGNKSKKI